MSRFISSFKLNVTLQVRNNLYAISIGLALVLVFVMRFFFSQQILATVVPVFILVSVGGTMYMFLAGLVIFEKSEHTLDSMIVTPLRTTEYLAAKIFSLMTLALIETSIITWFAYGWQFNPLWLYGGIVLISLMMVLVGIIQVVRYETVTDFLVPAILVGFISQLPLFVVMDLGVINWLWYVIPTTAPFMLMLAGFQSVELWQLAYGVVYSALWIAILTRWTYRAFDLHIIRKGVA